MVQVTLRIRETSGYHHSNKIKTFQLDSSSRLEELLIRSKTESNEAAKSTRAYLNGRELALNTSIASHNFRNNELIESCKSPFMSSALSSLLKDLDRIEKSIPDHNRRTKGLLLEILQVPNEMASIESFWDVKQWTDFHIKQRKICLATIKNVIQRGDRFASYDIPHCRTIEELHTNMKPVWSQTNRERHGRPRGNNVIADIAGTNIEGVGVGASNGRLDFFNLGNMLQPSTKRTGKPSTLYYLLAKKLEIQNEIVNAANRSGRNTNTPDYDPLEEFILLDELRHADDTHNNDISVNATARIGSPSRQRRRRRDNNSSDGDITINTTQAPSTILTNNVSTEGRLLVANNNSRSNKHYCPEYASGAFAVLCTLLESMYPQISNDPTIQRQERELSLTESQLKHRAQRRCRSNLYDKASGIGGRNAFTCMETLADKQLVRKEIGNFGTDNDENIEKWSLISLGEELAKDCLQFEHAVDHCLPKSLPGSNDRHKNGKSSVSKNDDLTLIVDNREDELFRERLKLCCADHYVNCEERELPAGDYLFVTQDGKVVPLIIERKSWSDLADSVMSRGNGHRRLDCVKIDPRNADIQTSAKHLYHSWQQEPHCTSTNCQLCKMKRSGCTQIMFIIEGSWCSNKDDGHRNENKCNPQKRCQSCKSLIDRHNGVTHDILEKVIHRLQVQHGCHIQFTSGYNETITTLLMIRDILLMEGDNFASLCFEKRISKRESCRLSHDDDDLARAIALSLGQDEKQTSEHDFLSFDEFTSNVRNISSTKSHVNRKKQGIVDYTMKDYAIKVVSEGRSWMSSLSMQMLDNVADTVQLEQPLLQPIAVDETSQEVIALNDESVSNSIENHAEVVEIDLSIDTSIDNVIDLSREIMDIPPDSRTSIDIIEIHDSRDESSSESTIDLLETEDSVATKFLHSTPLLLLQKIQHYNDTFMKHLNKVWKEKFDEKMKNNDLRNDQNSANGQLSTQAIQSIQSLLLDKNVSLLRREPFLFSIMFLQIKLGVLVRIATQKKHAEDIRQLWFESSNTQDLLTGINKTISNQSPSLSRQRHSDTFENANEHNNEEANDDIRTLEAEDDCFIGANNVGNFTCSKGNQNHSLTSHKQKCEEVQISSRKKFSDKRKVPEQSCDFELFDAYSPPIKRANNSSESKRDVRRVANETSVVRVSPHRAKLIEARLRRFEMPCAKSKVEASINHNNNNMNSMIASIQQETLWTCKECTLDNMPHVTICDACGHERYKAIVRVHEPPFRATPGNIPSSSGIINQHSSTKSGHDDLISLHNKTITKPVTKVSNMKCGACGNVGHNRATANERNCPAFFDDIEIEKRERKWREKQEKANRAEQELKELQEHNKTFEEQSAARDRQIQLLLEEQAKEKERYSELMKSELKQKEKAAKRAKKLADKGKW